MNEIRVTCVEMQRLLPSLLASLKTNQFHRFCGTAYKASLSIGTASPATLKKMECIITPTDAFEQEEVQEQSVKLLTLDYVYA
ncbi:hypothetical protein Hanom_Chr02g00123461 [Helianthus anomalus]